jgi:hypothetical protein
MPGERFFVPTTAWGASPATRPQPSFLPGESGPSWLGGPDEVRQVAMLCDPVLTLLYLAGYEIPMIVLGRGEQSGDRVALDTTDLRVRASTGTWSSQVGTVHPGGGVRAVALQALPMPHWQRSPAPGEAALAHPIPIDLTVAGVTLDADTGGWIVLDLTPVAARATIAMARQQLLGPVVAVVARFQEARTVGTPPGLSGMYDPANWRAVVPSGGAATFAGDARETLSRVTLRLTGGPQAWSNDNDPDTVPLANVDQVREFLEADLPDPSREPFQLDLDHGWDPVELQMNTTPVGIFDLDDHFRELAGLRRLGADPDLQGLTTTILDLHDRRLVDVLDGFAAASPAADPCAEAAAFATDLATPLSAAAVAVMCACLLARPVGHPDLVKQRLEDTLAADYSALYDQPEPRAAIRDSLIAACQAADSQNPALNPGGVAAPADSPHAEWFAELLAGVLTSEPTPTMPGFAVAGYANPLLEVADAWDRWAPLLESLPAGPKLIALTCDVFRECGHAQVALAAADRVIVHYREELARIWHQPDANGRPGHHWSHPVHGAEFSGMGSTRRGVEGWSGQLLVSLLTMLANTCEGTEHAHLYDALFELVGPDPVADYDIEAFEAEYAELLADSTEPLVAEYTLLLGLMDGYASAATEAEAARYNIRPLQQRFGELAADPVVIEELDRHREPAFMSVPNEWLSLEDLQLGIEAFARAPHHQALLICLDDEARRAYEEAMIERVRRVYPVATAEVLGVFVGVSFALEAGSLIEAMQQDELISMLDDVAEVHHYSVPSLSQKLAKVLKEGPIGIPKAFYSETLNTTRARIAWVAISRRAFWGAMRTGAGQDGPTHQAIQAFLRKDDEMRLLARLVEDELTVPVAKAAAAGHVFTVFVGGLVLWQLVTEGEPTDPDKILGASRDLGMAGVSAGLLMVQVGDLAVSYFRTAPDEWAAVVAGINVAGSFLSKLSTFVTLLSNALAMMRYLASGDYIGALLMLAATVASVVAFAAVASGVGLPAGAVAATIAALLGLMDVARHFVIFHLAEKALWDRTVGVRELLFAAAVAMVAPLDGKVVLTQPLPAVGEATATELGYIEPLVGGENNNDADDVVALDIGDGITAMYPVQEETGGHLFLVCPIPAMASRALLTDDRERSVSLGDVLLSLRPRFESWIVAAGTVFDAVFVEQDGRVAQGDVVASLAGKSLRAPHAGTVGAFETLTDSERIRIWADMP